MSRRDLLSRFFPNDNTHHILIPRGRLALLWLVLFGAEVTVCLLWQGIFIIAAVFCALPTLALLRAALRIWRRYYAVVWFFLLWCVTTALAIALRLAISRLS